MAGLRDRVKSYSVDTKVIIQPVLISTCHVQAEIAALLKGLNYTMSTSGVAAHPLTPEWIRQQAVTALRTRKIAQSSPR